MFSFSGINRAFLGDFLGDLLYLSLSGILVSCYAIIFLGGCSPIHFRSCLAVGGLFTIMVSYIAGNGIAGTLGNHTAGVHSLLSFLLIGIGADDMFVVCNALD